MIHGWTSKVYEKRKKPGTERCILYDLLTFRRRQNVKDRNHNSGLQRLEMIKECPQKGKFFAKVKEDEKLLISCWIIKLLIT